MELKFARTYGAIKAQARKGRKQSRRISIWTREEVDTVQHAVGSVLSQYGDDLTELVVIFREGSAYVHWNHDEHSVHYRPH